MPVCKQFSGQVARQSELRHAEDASSWLQALWRSILEHGEATELHLVQVALQCTMAQAKWAHKKYRLRAFGAASLNARDAIVGPSQLDPSIRHFLDASLQKNVRDFFIQVFHHFCAKRLAFHAIMSEHCNVVATMVDQRDEDICRIIAEGLDCASRRHEFGAIGISEVAVPRLVMVMKLPLAAQGRLHDSVRIFVDL